MYIKIKIYLVEFLLINIDKLMRMKRYLLFFLIISLFACNFLSKESCKNNIAKYLNVPLEKCNNLFFFEHHLIEGTDYPKAIYIRFDSENPESIISELSLMSFKDSSRLDSCTQKFYGYTKLINHFWEMRSTNETRNIEKIEQKDLTWWQPDSSNKMINYAAFYDDSLRKTVTHCGEWDGRCVLQKKNKTIFIQIDLFGR